MRSMYKHRRQNSTRVIIHCTAFDFSQMRCIVLIQHMRYSSLSEVWIPLAMDYNVMNPRHA